MTLTSQGAKGSSSLLKVISAPHKERSSSRLLHQMGRATQPEIHLFQPAE